MIVLKEKQKWWGIRDEWGRRQGTGEAEITSVRLFNRLGISCAKFTRGEDINVEVDFEVIERIKRLHFGVAIFRGDGVYCYGPNTDFDGCEIEALNVGKGRFDIRFKNVPLAPGDYYISVAIWDRKEVYPYCYHPACYRIEVMGENRHRQLLNLPSEWRGMVQTKERFSDGIREDLDLTFLEDKFRQVTETGRAKIARVALLYKDGQEASKFNTGDGISIQVTFLDAFIFLGNYIWIGIYRKDGIYCHGEARKLSEGGNEVILNYPALPLLRGNYCVSVGIWERTEAPPITCHHAMYPFEMSFDRGDHGTVYIEHSWSYSLP